MNKYSTLDLAPSTQLTVITGVSGQAWADAASRIASNSDVPLVPLVIGPGRTVTDLYFDWARLREVDEDGVILVRPDKIIAWRSKSMVADPEGALRDVLSNVLDKAV
jgi:2,4-dichlorophenol 6-monooxygenase